MNARHGYDAYDPQLEKVFDPDRDATGAEEAHEYVHGQMVEAYGSVGGDRVPWWKRLLR